MRQTDAVTACRAVSSTRRVRLTHNITYNIADVMGVSEVLLCPYRCLEYKMERLAYRFGE